jgi:ribosomal protein S18 acetylase RimI-like enzyme
MDKEGLLVEGFDRLATFAEVYNYAYYKNHIEELGFQKEVDWLEFVMKIPTALDDRLVRISEGMVKRLNLHFLPKNVSTREIVDRYGQEVFDVLDICYADLHGVVPSTPKVRASILKQFKQIIRREFISMVFNAEGRVVGFALTAPNISRSLKKSKGRLTKFGFWPSGALRIMREARRPKHIDMCLIAVLPEYRGKGINAMMINELTLAYIEHKIVSIETNLELETNENVMNQFEHMERKLIKRRRCYSKSIANN